MNLEELGALYRSMVPTTGAVEMRVHPTTLAVLKAWAPKPAPRWDYLPNRDPLPRYDGPASVLGLPVVVDDALPPLGWETRDPRGGVLKSGQIEPTWADMLMMVQGAYPVAAFEDRPAG